MAKIPIHIRPGKETDLPQIAAVLDEIFGHQKYEQRLALWNWRHTDNPANTESIPQFLVAEREQEIVGVQGVFPVRIKLGDETLTAACTCDFATKNSARSCGMKLKLKAFCPEFAPFCLTTSANASAHKINLALGGAPLTTAAKKYFKPISARRILDKAAEKEGLLGKLAANPLAQKMSSLLLNSILPVERRIHRFKTIDRARLEQISSFDQRYDRFWQEISKEHPILLVRDAMYLNWRYLRYPIDQIQAFALVEEENLLGYVLLQIRNDSDGLCSATILDLMVRSKDAAAFEHLAGEAVRIALEHKADYLMCQTSSTLWGSILLKHGFVLRESELSPYTYKNNSTVSNEFINQPENWLISAGDGDAFFAL